MTPRLLVLKFFARAPLFKSTPFSNPYRPLFGNVAFYVAISIRQDSELGVGLAVGQSACVCLTDLVLICVLSELDAVQVQGAIADRPRDPDPFLASGRKKFNLNLGSQGKIGESEQTHSNLAKIDAKSIDPGGASEYLHRGVQQLALPAAPVCFGIEFEIHRTTPERTS